MTDHGPTHTEDRHFHIEGRGENDLHSLELHRVGNIIYISTNNRCFGVGVEMAEQMIEGFQALISGAYDFASTETWERMELEKQRTKTQIESLPHRRQPPAVPDLEDL